MKNTSAKNTFLADRELLTRLAARMQVRRNKEVCTPIARELRRKGGRYASRWYRDPVLVAYRYLRRFIGGVWYRGGHHVGRLNFGPAICEHRGTWYADRLDGVELSVS